MVRLMVDWLLLEQIMFKKNWYRTILELFGKRLLKYYIVSVLNNRDTIALNQSLFLFIRLKNTILTFCYFQQVHLHFLAVFRTNFPRSSLDILKIKQTQIYTHSFIYVLRDYIQSINLLPHLYNFKNINGFVFRLPISPLLELVNCNEKETIFTDISDTFNKFSNDFRLCSLRTSGARMKVIMVKLSQQDRTSFTPSQKLSSHSL